ncbi:MAG: chromosome segregation protein SMC [Nitrospirae bacterium]|nr:chromosome segregation protein SMC [Candidatus Troglogloeales bacterium]
MYLKRLELIGFKSFFDKTIVDLKPGMTAIVGPNGCGKSNLIDAILWVLGEQRPKSLRGEKMEDVIFNGTEHRKPLGMAEVSLTMGDISEPTLSPYSPYSEVRFTRRLFRSGESEYLINQVPCRLKDIRELLIDFRAGYKIHSIIEQGRVDELLSSSPLQRRELVEEAANVTKYRIRKEEAIRKLDSTEKNLIRIQDISSEVKRQINALDRQARQAQKYQRIYEDLKFHDLAIASIELKEWTQAGETLLREDQALRQSLIQKEIHEGSCGLQVAAARIALAEKEQEISKQKDQMAVVDGKIARAEGKVERTRAQKKEWTEIEERTKVELAEVAKAEEANVLERSLLEEDQQKNDQALPEIKTAILNREAQIKQVGERLAQKSEAVERTRTELFERVSRLTEARNNLVHFNARKETLARKSEAYAVRANEIEQQRGITGKRLEKLQEEWAATEHQTIERREALNLILLDLKHSERKQEEDKTTLYKIKEDWARKLAELASKEGFYRGLLSPTGVTKPAGDVSLDLECSFDFVADLIDVPADYEKAIEAALGERLRGMVVKDIADLQKGIKQLQALKSGRGTFILLHSPVSRFQSEKAVESPLLPEVIGPAVHLVSCKEGYEAVVQRLLDGVWVVRDIDSALLWFTTAPLPEHLKLIVSLQGEVVDPAGIFSGGEGSRLFEQKRGMAALSEETAKLQSEAEQLETRIDQNRTVQRETQFQTEQLEGAVRESEFKIQTLQKEMNARSLENDKMQLTHQTFLFEQEAESQEGATLSESREKELLVIAVLEQQKEEKERLFSLSMQERETVLSEKKEVEEGLVLLQLQLISLKEKQQRVLEKMDQIARSSALLKGRREDKMGLLASLIGKSVLAEEEESESLLEIEESAVLRNRILEAVRKIAEDHASTLEILASLEAEGKKLLLEKNNIVAALNDNSVRQITAKMTLEKIRETILTQYQIEIATDLLSENNQGAASSAPTLEEMRQKRDQLRGSLTAVGPVSLSAIEEYKGLTERYEFLKAQEEDLAKSTEDLKSAIAKINKTTEGLFIETFHALNEKFSETFTSFFGGGKGELVLVDAKNPLESGIEIVAAPPGKRPKSLSLLSGGEKALTALSLLFATFLNQPAPFCVLDEVDAPLDDENTRRFALAIERLAEQTQFMIITHNGGTAPSSQSTNLSRSKIRNRPS